MEMEEATTCTDVGYCERDAAMVRVYCVRMS